ncbi:MAG: hypothetical protein MK033_02400 [Candidatus Caenarcaniphilales bacterium]|nr:hypothetical protein [Candidatus Caenarcaniphilales bacterium]
MVDNNLNNNGFAAGRFTFKPSKVGNNTPITDAEVIDETPVKDTSGDKVSINSTGAGTLTQEQDSEAYKSIRKKIYILNTGFDIDKEDMNKLSSESKKNIYKSLQTGTDLEKERLASTFFGSSFFGDLDSSRSSTIQGSFNSILYGEASFDEDAAGYMYIAGMGNIPYYDDSSMGATKDELEKLQKERLEAFLSLTQTGNAEDILSRKKAAAGGDELTDEDKYEVYAALQEELRSKKHLMSASELRKIADALGEGFNGVTLMTELDSYDKANSALNEAREEIEDKEYDLDQLFQANREARDGLKLAFVDSAPLYFGAPAGKGDEALEKYQNLLFAEVPGLKDKENPLTYTTSIEEDQLINKTRKEIQSLYNFEMVLS